MPPQNDQQSASSEPANFDFMLKQQPAQPNQSPTGKLSRLSRPAKLLILAVVGLLISIVAAVILGGGNSNSQQVLGLMAQNQEIVRVSQLQDEKLRDPSTKGLSATTQAALKSQNAQLGDYLSKAGVKYDPKQLGAKQNKNTDSELQAAEQNNNLDQAYINYLKNALTNYLNSLESVYPTSKSRTLQESLSQSYDSVETLLKSSQFKS
jgi:hypothetical protein